MDLLNAVALKLVSSDSEISSVSLLSAPAGYSNPVLLSGLDAGGCSGTLDGYFCGPYTDSGFGKQVAHFGVVYNFEWLTLTSGSSLLTIDSVKALYVTSAGQQHGITSEDITLTPKTNRHPGAVLARALWDRNPWNCYDNLSPCPTAKDIVSPGQAIPQSMNRRTHGAHTTCAPVFVKGP